MSLVVHGTATATTADAVGLVVAMGTALAFPFVGCRRLVLFACCSLRPIVVLGLMGNTYRLPKELVPLAIQLLVHQIMKQRLLRP